MGKQSKGEPKANQKRHNRNTKGFNTNRRRVEIDYDEFYLEWPEELAFYAAMNGYKIVKLENDHGPFEYIVIDSWGDIILTVESEKNVMFAPKRKRRRKHRKR